MSHTPLTHRALVEREKAQLRREELGLDKFIEVTIVIFALLVIAIIIATIVPRLSILLGIILLLAGCTFLVLVYLLFMLSRYKADLKDHVYEVHGKMIKKGKMSSDHRITVGNQTFRATPANPMLWDFFLKTADGTPVSVYYSPRTKIVWSIKEL